MYRLFHEKIRKVRPESNCVSNEKKADTKLDIIEKNYTEKKAFTKKSVGADSKALEKRKQTAELKKIKADKRIYNATKKIDNYKIRSVYKQILRNLPNLPGMDSSESCSQDNLCPEIKLIQAIYYTEMYHK